MAQVTPAFIKYKAEGDPQESIVKFHAVMSEDHEALSEITKFPVQSGFMISNNSIRRNRKVSIKGIISNKVLDGTKNDYVFSETNNSRAAFETLEYLVNSGTTCNVTTNLGDYDPVVFISFKTKQIAGMVDAMEFTLSGEEIQISTTVTGSAPKVLSFTELSGAARENRLNLLAEAGMKFCEGAKVSEASMTMGQDVIIEGVDKANKAVNSTYLATGQDPTTGGWFYDMHTSAVDMYENTLNVTQDLVGGVGNIYDQVTAGFSPVGNCLADGALDVAGDFVEDVLTTEMGELKKSLYGALYTTMGMTDNEYGQNLIHAGVGCIVRGITNFDPKFPYRPGEALPTVGQMMEGLENWGSIQSEGNTNSTTNGLVGAATDLTKIEGC